jgi:hypothetical protein
METCGFASKVIVDNKGGVVKIAAETNGNVSKSKPGKLEYLQGVIPTKAPVQEESGFT